jgi:hypothetical protein
MWGLETSVAPFGWCLEKKAILLDFKIKCKSIYEVKHQLVNFIKVASPHCKQKNPIIP